jgi:5-methylcytosine-specific restriction endonuclease McrA
MRISDCGFKDRSVDCNQRRSHLPSIRIPHSAIHNLKGGAGMAILNGRVLLLNFSYEPLGTVGVARAMCLVIRGVVHVEEFDGARVLRSARAEFQVPSVIRLRRYVNVRRKRQTPGMRRFRIFVRDQFRCQYCGAKLAASELTLDHITPRSKRGRSTQENLVTACVRCNTRKGSRTPEEARMPLLTSQKALQIGLEHVLLCYYAESRPEWRKYLLIEDPPEDERRKRA